MSRAKAGLSGDVPGGKEARGWIKLERSIVRNLMPMASGAEWKILTVLLDRTNGLERTRYQISAGQLAQLAGLSTRAVWASVPKIAERGWIHIPDGGKRIAYYIDLTPILEASRTAKSAVLEVESRTAKKEAQNCKKGSPELQKVQPSEEALKNPLKKNPSSEQHFGKREQDGTTTTALSWINFEHRDVLREALQEHAGLDIAPDDDLLTQVFLKLGNEDALGYFLTTKLPMTKPAGRSYGFYVQVADTMDKNPEVIAEWRANLGAGPLTFAQRIRRTKFSERMREESERRSAAPMDTTTAPEPVCIRCHGDGVVWTGETPMEPNGGYEPCTCEKAATPERAAKLTADYRRGAQELEEFGRRRRAGDSKRVIEAP